MRAVRTRKRAQRSIVIMTTTTTSLGSTTTQEKFPKGITTITHHEDRAQCLILPLMTSFLPVGLWAHIELAAAVRRDGCRGYCTSVYRA